jgi:hypothetical protein
MGFAEALYLIILISVELIRFGLIQGPVRLSQEPLALMRVW